MRFQVLLFTFLAGLGAAAAIAGEPGDTPEQAADAFFEALTAGDFAKAKSLLDPQVRIFESGGVERSADEYAAHHMKSDAAFLATAAREVTTRTVGQAGDLAWIATEERISGTLRDEPIELDSTETMVLRRTADGWRIVHIHWSSRPAR